MQGQSTRFPCNQKDCSRSCPRASRPCGWDGMHTESRAHAPRSLHVTANFCEPAPHAVEHSPCATLLQAYAWVSPIVNVMPLNRRVVLPAADHGHRAHTRTHMHTANLIQTSCTCRGPLLVPVMPCVHESLGGGGEGHHAWPHLPQHMHCTPCQARTHNKQHREGGGPRKSAGAHGCPNGEGWDTPGDDSGTVLPTATNKPRGQEHQHFKSPQSKK